MLGEDSRGINICFACGECGGELSFSSGRRGRVETCHHCGAFVDVPERSQTTAVVAPIGSVPVSEFSFVVRNPSRAELWQDMGVATCLLLIPWWLGCLGYLSGWSSFTANFAYTHLILMATSLQVSVPLLMISRFRSPSWRECGLVRPVWIADTIVGSGVWVAGTAASMFALSLLSAPWAELRFLEGVAFAEAPNGILQNLLMVVAAAANGFTEEFAMRGFLFTRLELLLKSRWGTILLTTVLFASYHVYQGIGRTLGIAAIGVGLRDRVLCVPSHLAAGHRARDHRFRRPSVRLKAARKTRVASDAAKWAHSMLRGLGRDPFGQFHERRLQVQLFLLEQR